MKNRKLSIFLLLCVLVSVSIFAVTAADKNAPLVAVVEQFFKALKDKDMEALNTQFVTETGALNLNGNQLKVPLGRFCFGKFLRVINYNYKTEELQIIQSKNSAMISGNVTIMMNDLLEGLQKGAWHFEMMLVKEKKTWQISHMDLSYLASLKYLLYLPTDYNADPQKKWPMILYLHGSGERGNDLELLKQQAIPKLIAQKKDFPFIIVAPQCPLTSSWLYTLQSLKLLIDEVCAKYAVDPDRICVTGNSMGGYGTWALAATYPDRFAAIAPICGGGYPKDALIIKNIPTWVFHGVKDGTVPIEESQVMIDALKACSGNVKFTFYPDLDHDSWTTTYNNPELYEWFLQQKRGTK